MAALRVVLARRAPPGAPPPAQAGPSRRAAGTLLQRLGRWFYEAEAAATWAERLRRRRLRSRNAPRDLLREQYGPDVAAAAFTLSLGGGVRFEGQERWIGPRDRWLPPPPDVPVVALDLSDTPVTYSGLDNLVPLAHLQHLDLAGCPHLDDWALARLHVFAPSLRLLSLARCPRVTERGLATLHHLRGLRHLELGGLQLPSPELLRLLLEEALPGCQLRGLGPPPGGGGSAGNPPEDSDSMGTPP